MALEFGAAAHEVFAAIYLYQVGYVQNLKEHMYVHADRIFGLNRFEAALKTVDPNPSPEDAITSLGFNILHSGEFFDDPHDTIRTISNLELGIQRYVSEVYPIMDKWPIWISDPKKPEYPIGVECAFDITLERTDFNLKSEKKDDRSKRVRFIGQIDRLHEITRDSKQHLVLGENKTGSRLDSAWALSFDMSHQITGYLLAAYTITGRPCTRSRVHGLKNKQTGAAEDFNPISPMDRTSEMFEAFIDWAIDANDTYEKYTQDYEHAPRYTHSCNRYFRPCALIPFCCDTREGRVEQLEQMVSSDLSPSEQAVMDRLGLLE